MVPVAFGQWRAKISTYQRINVKQRYHVKVIVFFILLNILLPEDYSSNVAAEIVGANASSLDNMVKPLDINLPPTLPMTFGTKNSTVISAQSGSTALLPCVVHNVGDGLVSWIKWNDQRLLTVGLGTYASDARFQAIHFYHSEDWSLQIKYVQQRDSGLYECQVSTHPPTSIYLILDVVDAHAEIAGPAEKFLRPGSTLQLHCLVKKSTETPSYMFWYHNLRMINYDIDQGANVSTDLLGRESWLEVSHTSERHSGNYTCEASNARPARVFVHIFNGDNPAAMQHSAASLPMDCTILLILLTALEFVLHSALAT